MMATTRLPGGLQAWADRAGPDGATAFDEDVVISVQHEELPSDDDAELFVIRQ
jgi:hypothetical protein